ncbi:peptidoglycan-binding protein [Streptomyces torulosus]|uniref:peptidoglycan-binding protein n=1 Tax=Streptomyces torulosus TaxID=68276 RepID=UPI0006EBC786|nr:peptidoglycan-binding protein [Streptomyces torulosus]
MSGSTLARQRHRSVLSVAAAVLAATLALTVGILIGPAVRSPAQAVADAGPPEASLVTVAAERRVLAEPVIARGTVRPGTSVKVAAPAGLGGDTAVVTRLTAKTGTALREGDIFAEVSGAPLFGLVLPFPLYRDLSTGMQGPDVTAVQKALRRLGTSAQVTGTFDTATERALVGFYRARGYEPPRPQAPHDPAVAPFGKPSANAPEAATVILRRTAVVALDRDARTISAVRVKVGSVLGDANSVLLELDTAAVTVQVKVDKKQRALVRTGGTAEIVDETQGTALKAVVRRVADRAGADGYEVSLAFTGPALSPGGDHTVLVTLDPMRDTEPVLAVPVAAVYSRPDGTTFVTVEGKDHSLTDVGVDSGKVAGGWVQVTPERTGFTAGARVVVGSSADTGPLGSEGDGP